MKEDNMSRNVVREHSQQAQAKSIKMMRSGKIYIITDTAGTVIGTARSATGAASIGRPVPLAGQRLHEIDYSPDLHDMMSVEQLHKAVAQLITESP